MYENILLPVDGSDGAAEVVYHASEIAHYTDASIRVLYVADTTRDSVTVVGDRVVDALVREGETVVAETGETLETLGVDYETDVVQGAPAETIVEYAERYDHDLVVMSTHGRTGLSRYLLGSVTEKVVRTSSVPVLTARMQPDEELTFPYERVLVTTDGSDEAMYAARHGVALADALDASVHVLSVVDDTLFGPDARSNLIERELEQAATDAVEDVVALAEAEGIGEVVGHVEGGSPPAAIREEIDACDIHAVVMGTAGRRGIERVLLGSVAEKTVRTAPVPVVTVAPGQ